MKKVLTILFLTFTLASCSKEKEQLAEYHNQIVNLHNEIKITYQELVDDFGWIISNDTSASARRSFAKEYKSHFRNYRHDAQQIRTIEEDDELGLKASLMDMLDYLIDYTDSLSAAAGELIQGKDSVFNFAEFDGKIANYFEVIEQKRNQYCKEQELQ